MIERILALMDDRGVNASEFTKEIGVNHGAVTDWKKGKGKPSAETITKIANYFNVTTDYLLLGTQENEKRPLLSEALVAFERKEADFTEEEKDLLEAFAETLLMRRETKKGD